MLYIYIVFSAAPVTTTTTASPSCISSAYSSYMSQYNVITLADFRSSSDVESRTIVCGNFINGATFANQLSQSTFNPLTYTLEINGTTVNSGNININCGSVALGPYPSNRYVQNVNNPIQYTIDNHITCTLNQGNQGAKVQNDSTLPSRCNTITSSIISLSQSLSQLPPNNNVTIPSGQPGPLNFNVNNVDANGVAVFNVSLTSVFSNSNVQQIQLNPPNTNLQLVVINLYGTSATWSTGNLVGSWFDSVTTGRSHTIWNFYQATSLTLNNNIKGAVLAPYAVVTTGSNMDGAVAVKTLYAGGEVHLPLVVFPNCTTASQFSMNHILDFL
jgi:choice-of-anchor A domain-containing protein